MTRATPLAARRDANEPEIVEILRGLGCSVSYDCALDLLVAHATRTGRRTFMLEVKDGSLPPSARALTTAERAFIQSWRGEVYVVTSTDEALAVFWQGGDPTLSHVFERLRREVAAIKEKA